METISHIPFDLDVNALMEKVHVEPDSDDAREFASFVDRARAIARPKAVYRECFIDAKGRDDTVTIGGMVFGSRTLRRNLDKAERVFAYVATCGRDLDGRTYFLGALQHLDAHLRRRYRLGKTASMSPGSGDADTWPLEQQRELFTLLGGMNEVRQQSGVELTPSLLMVPNKTVSGIRFPTETDFRSCQVCHRENCPSRSVPFDGKLWESIEHAQD